MTECIGAMLQQSIHPLIKMIIETKNNKEPNQTRFLFKKNKQKESLREIKQTNKQTNKQKMSKKRNNKQSNRCFICF